MNGEPKQLPLQSLVVWRVVSLFAIFGFLWIATSDRLLQWWVDDPALLTELQTAKGWLFVLASSGMLFVLLRRESRRGAESRHALLRIGRERDILFEEAAEAMLLVNGDARIGEVNETALGVFGRPRDALIGATLDELIQFGADDSPLSALDGTVPRAGDAALVRPDGERRQVLLSVVPVIRPKTHLVIARDMTERQALESQLREAEKLESVGRLAAGVSHDFNNLLTVILGYTELALASEETSATLERWLKEVHRSTERGIELAQELLAVGGRAVVRPETVDVNAFVEDLGQTFRKLLGEEYGLELELASGVILAESEPRNLERVVLNLVANARDASAPGSSVTVGTSIRRWSAEELRRRGSNMEEGSYVSVFVRDEGLGMDDETRRKIFEPFFTTKGSGQGTGLGLATVLSLTLSLGGTVLVESAPNAGSTFEVLLPASG